MRQLTNILGGIGILIAVYLILTNARATTQVLTGLISSASDGIKVLQGR